MSTIKEKGQRHGRTQPFPGVVYDDDSDRIILEFLALGLPKDWHKETPHDSTAFVVNPILPNKTHIFHWFQLDGDQGFCMLVVDYHQINAAGYNFVQTLLIEGLGLDPKAVNESFNDAGQWRETPIVNTDFN